MKNFCTITHPNKNVIFPLFMAICHLGQTIVLQITCDNKLHEDYQHIILCFLMFIGESLAIILFLFKRHQTHKRTKSIINNITSSGEESSVAVPSRHTYAYKLISKKKMCLLIILITSMDCFASLCLFRLKQFEMNFYEFSLKMFVIFFMMGFSTFFLKLKYYRHHFVGVCLICCAVIINIVQQLIDHDFKIEGFQNEKAIITIISFFGFQISTTVVECSEKYIMHYYYLDPYLILTLEGLFGIVIMPILFPLYVFIDEKYTYRGLLIAFSEVFSKTPKLIASIGFILTIFGFNVFRLLTNNAFGPCYRTIADLLGLFFDWVFELSVLLPLGKSKPHEFWHYIYEFLCYLIILLGLLIFLELLRLKFCKLNLYTIQEIDKRQLLDFEELPQDLILKNTGTEKELSMSETETESENDEFNNKHINNLI